MSSTSCPICRKPVEEGAKHFPFCSERCRWVDLGHWLEERYQVPRDDSENDKRAEEPEKKDY